MQIFEFGYNFYFKILFIHYILDICLEEKKTKKKMVKKTDFIFAQLAKKILYRKKLAEKGRWASTKIFWYICAWKMEGKLKKIRGLQLTRKIM